MTTVTLLNSTALGANGAAIAARGGGWSVISSRPNRPSSIGTGISSQSTRMWQKAPCDILGLRTAYSNTFTNGNGENAYPCAIYVESVYQPKGTQYGELTAVPEYPLTVGGKKGAWIRSGGFMLTDPIFAPILTGTDYYIKTFVKVSTKAPPSAPTSVGSTVGGTLAAGTYTISATYVYPDGEETAGSATASITTTGATSSIAITSPAAATGAIGWRPYVSTSSGGTTQYQTPVDILDIGTNYTHATPIATTLNANLTVPCVTGGVTPAVPTGITIAGGVAQPYQIGNGDGHADGLYYVNCAQRIAENSATTGFGPLFILGLNAVSYPGIIVTGDSLLQAIADYGFLPTGSAGGAGLGGGVIRALLGQTGNRRIDLTIVPKFGFVWSATGGERGDQYIGLGGNRRRLWEGYGTSVIDNYATNDFSNLATGADVIDTTCQRATYAIAMGRRYIRLTTAPRTNSTSGWRDPSDQSFQIYNGTIQVEGYRRLFNAWQLDASPSSALVDEAMFCCYATGNSATNVYAGGNGTAVRFIARRPFQIGSELVKVNGVAKVLTTDYTYDKTNTINGITYASGVIFGAAPGNGLSVTMSYSTLAGFRSTFGERVRVWDWTKRIESDAAGNLGTNGGFWAAPVGGTLATLTVTSTSTTSLSDSSKAYTQNQWAGYAMMITADGTTPASVNQVRCIGFNTATSINSCTSWTTTPATGATAIIFDGLTQDGTHPTSKAAMLMGEDCTLADIE